MLKYLKLVGILLAVLVGVLTFPTRAAAKCPEVAGDLVCPELRYYFLPVNPTAGEEITVKAYWINQLTAGPVIKFAWLARKGKPAYMWLWDHEPSELESIAHYKGIAGTAKLPQILVPLDWDAEKQVYQGTFKYPKPGRWYYRIGTLVPDALRATLEADFDFGGKIEQIDIPVDNRALFEPINLIIWPVLFLGIVLATFLVLWLGKASPRYRNHHSTS